MALATPGITLLTFQAIDTAQRFYKIDNIVGLGVAIGVPLLILASGAAGPLRYAFGWVS